MAPVALGFKDFLTHDPSSDLLVTSPEYQKGKTIARANVPLQPKPVYRAVVLWFYPGMYYPEVQNYRGQVQQQRTLPEPKTYTNADGESFLYHDYECLGPYSTISAARGSVTRESKSQYYGYRKEDYVVYAEVEETTGSWNKVPKKVK